MYICICMYISRSIFELGQEASGGDERVRTTGRPPIAPSRPGWLDRGASIGKSRPSRSTEALRATKVDRKGRPRRSETRFSTIPGRFSGRFSVFFEVAVGERLDSHREGPNLCFCWQAWYETHISHFAKKTENRRKSLKNRSDGASRTSHTKKHRFFRSRTRPGVDFGRLGALPDAPGRPFWRPAAPLGTLRALPGRAGDAPRCSQDAPESPPGCSWAPWGVPRGSQDRF